MLPKTAASFWVFFWATAIFLSSTTDVTPSQLSLSVATISTGTISASSFQTAWDQVWWMFVKEWHAAEFGILYTVFHRAKLKYGAGWAVCCAFLDEIHQTFIPHRGGKLSDVAIDLIGIYVAAQLLSVKRKPNWLVLIAGCFIAIYVLSAFPFGSLEH